MEDGKRAAQLALRHRHDLSCIALDLDYFKSVNDNHGHASGDAVLVETIKACSKELRSTDIIGRLGGEEFAVLLPHTGRASALEIAERLRAAIEGISVESSTHEKLTVTASFGVALLDASTKDIASLVKNADAALYQAKASGRNRVFAFKSAGTEGDTTRRRVFKGGQSTSMAEIQHGLHGAQPVAYRRRHRGLCIGRVAAPVRSCDQIRQFRETMSHSVDDRKAPRSRVLLKWLAHMSFVAVVPCLVV